MTRRKIGPICEHAAKKRVDDPVNRAADLGYHLDSGDPQRGFKLMANPTTDHDIHTQLPKGRNTAVILNILVRSVLDVAILHVEDAEVFRYVE